MHRYEPSLVARIRTDYLHKTQKAIEQRIENNNNIINNSSSKQDVAKATKEKAKLQKKMEKLEEQIAALEDEIAAKKDELLNPEYASAYSKLSEIQAAIDEGEEKLLDLMSEWGDLDKAISEFD